MHLIKSISVQYRVIGALLLRETITRYGRHNIGFLWLFLEPIIFTLCVTLLWSVSKGGGAISNNISIIAFAVTGYGAVLLWRNITNRCINALTPNLSLMHHRMVKVFDIYAARIILEGVGATGSMMLLLTMLVWTNQIDMPIDIGRMLFAWILLGWFGGCLGIIVGTFCTNSESAERLWHAFIYITFPFSGALFFLDWMNPNLREILSYIPTVQCTEMLRHGFFGESIKTYEEVEYIFSVNIIMTLIALVSVRRITYE